MAAPKVAASDPLWQEAEVSGIGSGHVFSCGTETSFSTGTSFSTETSFLSETSFWIGKGLRVFLTFLTFFGREKMQKMLMMTMILFSFSFCFFHF